MNKRAPSALPHDAAVCAHLSLFPPFLSTPAHHTSTHQLPPSCLPPLQLGPVLRDELLAGNRWRATFTATALNHCELYLLPAEDFRRVLLDHPEVAEELRARSEQ